MSMTETAGLAPSSDQGSQMAGPPQPLLELGQNLFYFTAKTELSIGLRIVVSASIGGIEDATNIEVSNGTQTTDH